MDRIHKTTIALVAAVMVMMCAWVGAVQAREGFYLGGGFADQSVSGGLDGNKDFSDSTGTVAILAGKPDAGTGFAILGGYGINKLISIDVLIADTSHTATHSDVNFNSKMNLTTTLISAKFSHDLADNVEIYGRVGLATATATYAKYALKGNISGGTFSSTSEAKFDGSGFGAGGGVEYMIDKVGLSANYNLLSIRFDEASGGGVSGKLPSALSSTINQITFNATYYFK